MPVYDEETGLTVKQRKFVEEFVRLGVSVHAYGIAYGFDTSDTTSSAYNTASSESTRLWKDARICKYLDVCLGLTAESCDRELSTLILQNDDRSVKLQALKFAAELRKRITKRIELSGPDEGPIEIKASLLNKLGIKNADDANSI
jgi:hypothetical protein